MNHKKESGSKSVLSMVYCSLFTVIIALYICASTHMTALQLKKARYLLTDRRIIVMNNDFTFRSPVTIAADQSISWAF